VFAAAQMKPCSVEIVKIKQPPAQKNETSSEKQRIYNCKFCKMTSRLYKKLDNHLRVKHPNKTVYKCDYVACLNLIFDSDDEKRKHMEALHNSNSDGPKVAKCVYCGQISIDRKSLWSHMMIFHKNTKIVRCNYKLCADYLKSEADRQQHMEEKHPVSKDAKKCVYCNEWVRFMAQHVRNLHKHIAIKCNYSVHCCNFFKSNRDRDEHIEKEHLAGKIRQKKECIYCGKSYSEGGPFLAHIKTIHYSIAVKCSFIKCVQFFKTQEDCDKHFKEMHEEKEKLKKIHCHLCKYKTSEKCCFKQHWQARHGKDNLKCSHCPSRNWIYRSIEALNHHIKTTHLEKKTCPHCNQSMHKHGLKSHLLTEYCPLCKVNYFCKSTMKEHKKWCKRKCEICKQEFAGNVPLLMHISKMHKNVKVKKLSWLGDLQQNALKNVKCKKCERCFFNEAGLRRHVSLIHRGNQPKNTVLTCHFCKKELKGRYHLERHMICIHGFKEIRLRKPN
jgi:hypothetical protein